MFSKKVQRQKQNKNIRAKRRKRYQYKVNFILPNQQRHIIIDLVLISIHIMKSKTEKQGLQAGESQ